MKWMEALVAGSRMRKLMFLSMVLAVSITAVASAAKSQKTSGVAYVGVTHAEGSDLYVSGDFKDDLLGRGAIVYVTQVSSGPEPDSVLIEARQITIYTKKGSLTGDGEAVQTTSPDGTSTISDGNFNLTKGTGAYKGHSLKGTLDGTFEDGVYTFNYDARYK